MVWYSHLPKSSHSLSWSTHTVKSFSIVNETEIDVFFFWNSLSFSETESCSVVSDSLWPHGLYSPWNSSDQNTRVGNLSLLQGIFPTQGLNPGLLYCRQIFYQLSHKGSPRILEWVAYPFSSGSSWPRNWTGVSCSAGGFFTNWATKEAFSIVQQMLAIWSLVLPFLNPAWTPGSSRFT